MKRPKYIAFKIVFLVIFFIRSFVFASPVDYPQNIILIIVDGGRFNHIDATDYYQYGKKGEQPFEKFPVKLAVTTYPAGGSYDPNRAVSDFNYVTTGKITDSAAAATALATGVKTKKGSIGVDVNGSRLENVIEKCEKLGMATGVITTVPFSHATPAGFVAHQNSRGQYSQIVEEMVFKSAADVIFGCGHFLYDDDGKKLNGKTNSEFIGSKELWDSIMQGAVGADADADGLADKWTLIQSKQEFLNLANGQTPKRVLGIVQAAKTLQVSRSGVSKVPFDVPFDQNVPTLAEMSSAALNVLDDDKDGFFVMIEGGAVDWASHGNNSARMIEEMIDFETAVKSVVEWVETKNSWEKTLVIITADHQTGYLTGVVNGGRGVLPQMRWNSTDHTNSLVFFFAKGRGSKLFEQEAKNKDARYGRYIDNTDIAKVIFALLEQRVSIKK